MFVQTKNQKKLRLFSNNSSMTSSMELAPKYDAMFSAEAEQRINDWLDAQNIIQKAPEEHFRDFFQQSKEQAQYQINLLIHQNSFSNDSSQQSLPELEMSLSSSCSSCISSPGSLDLKRSPILNRRRINIGDLLISNNQNQYDSIQELRF
ncbi:hypothetical protein TTHERM_00041520 (macronuclear) [Tetrahymena thermophila SB210]|uniref:Uncharacterized protein n=1 Tax=Tetrahymena thermophila (strain SB210) TaxID=312017 RepID=Q22LW5_TETTS|nr:hypothetical protein TTHERM_00041520 [Tetrahymena thermophila SB210]EAR86264.1 hypothetical protein TTHERM_00041520 [Tetrahymena thermophila SB210]|eukprot:XP_977255.1 hypothetical protein TTHERM_00041520 [Tetrahymena thermophila SB210]